MSRHRLEHQERRRRPRHQPRLGPRPRRLRLLVHERSRRGLPVRRLGPCAHHQHRGAAVRRSQSGEAAGGTACGVGHLSAKPEREAGRRLHDQRGGHEDADPQRLRLGRSRGTHARL
jgi:hypothetical protein